MSLTGWYRPTCRNRFLLSGKPSLKGPLSSGTNECARVDSSRQAHEKAGVEGMVLYRKSSMKAVLFVIVGLVLGLTATAAAMTLRSSDIRPNGMIAKRFIFNSFGCTGENAQPSVAWSGVPTGAKALALTVFDPDAPTTVGFVHWLLLRIPPTATSTTNAPAAVNGLTDFGEPGYHGPCPPVGDKPHRYIFTLYALDTDFPFTPQTTYAAFRFTIRRHVLATATLIGRYGR